MSLKNLDIEAVKNKDISILNEPLEVEVDNTVKIIEDCSKIEYIYLGNIPSSFRSFDLRYFFKNFVEKKAFKCFHFRHRPEKQIIVDEKNANRNVDAHGSKVSKDETTYCCILQIYTEYVNSFIEKYNNKEWRKKDLTFGKRPVLIRKLKVKSRSDDENKYKSKKEKGLEKHLDDQEVYIEDLIKSIELNPPQYVMPNGNVGTTTKYFHGLIKECKMPPSLIKSLDLDFPTSHINKVYSNVPFDYALIKKRPKQKDSDKIDFSIADNKQYLKNKDTSSITENQDSPHGVHLKTEQKREEKGSNDSLDNKDDADSSIRDNQDSPLFENEPKREENHSDDSLDEEDEAEDWERHEALHDDVDNQSRPKERLFEEDIELKWEKGGSGLVFYTDAYFWNEMKGKDFDEDTVDDWDVDYSIYYENGAGDKPARDQYNIYKEQKLREGCKPTNASQLRRKENIHRKRMTTKFAEFEKYSKGFGSKILKRQGWQEGSGVGVSTDGISEPIVLDGQGPSSHVGLGFYGEKLDRTLNLKRKVEREIHITTKYDDEEI